METCNEQYERLQKWQRRFAWLPVYLGRGDWVWLEHYERGLWSAYYGFHYRLPASAPEERK